MENNKLTRKGKIDYLIENTTEFYNNPIKDFWAQYLNYRLENNQISHKELNDMIDYCDETNGGCLMNLYFER